MAALGTEPAKVFLNGVCGYFKAFLESRGGAMSCQTLEELRHDSAVGGWNPCGLLFLLQDAGAAAGISHCTGVFTALPLDMLRETEKRVAAYLDADMPPRRASEIVAAVPDLPINKASGKPAMAMDVLLANSSLVAGTTDGRYFIPERSLRYLVTEAMRSLALPAHHTAILRRVKEAVTSLRRVRDYQVLQVLRERTEFTSPADGYYELKET